MIDSMKELADLLVVQAVSECRTAVPHPIIQPNGQPALVWRSCVYSITQAPPVLDEPKPEEDHE